jgi:hypothetical protein
MCGRIRIKKEIKNNAAECIDGSAAVRMLMLRTKSGSLHLLIIVAPVISDGAARTASYAQPDGRFNSNLITGLRLPALNKHKEMLCGVRF